MYQTEPERLTRINSPPIMIPWPNAGLLLAHRLRRWASFRPALERSLVFAGDMSRSAFVMRWKRICLLGRAVGTRLCNCIHLRAIEITPLQCLVACPLSTKLRARLFGSTSEGLGRGSSREQSQTVKMGTVVHVILFNKIVCAFPHDSVWERSRYIHNLTM